MLSIYRGTICVICGEKERHTSPGVMTRETIYQHRITEDRNCPKFEDCLTVAAHRNAVCIPCIVCRKGVKHAS